MKKYDYLIVGAGLAGSVMAERLASIGKTCLVVDRRNHIGGLVYDAYDKSGVLVHKYGAHYFYTNSETIVKYLSQFTDWHYAECRMLLSFDGRLWQFPVNLNTFEQVLGRKSSEKEMLLALKRWRVPISDPKNLEDVILNSAGKFFYKKFYEKHFVKFSGLHPREWDISMARSIPIRANRDNRYFTSKFQALPRDGYGKMFERMLRHPNIEVLLDVDYRFLIKKIVFKRLIYTGLIDEYFDFRLGRIPYGSLRFEYETVEKEFYQPVGQVDYPNDDHEFVSIIESKHFTGQKIPLTTIVREYAQAYVPNVNEPYGMSPSPKAVELYKEYKALTNQKMDKISFVCWGGSRTMEQVIGGAMEEFERLKRMG